MIIRKLFTSVIPVLVIAFILVVWGMVFVVEQRNTGLVIQFGKIVREIREPGLYFKIPIIQRSVLFEKRMITLDENEPTRVTTKEKSDLLVDMFVKWRIADAKPFYTQIRTISSAQNRISQVINANLREEFGLRSVSDVISGQRDEVMDILRKKTSADLQAYGITIVDVRLKGIELPQNVLVSAFDRMRAERLRVANERRSTGAAESERLRAEADKKSQIILAEANRDSLKVKGEGDADATAIYAEAYGSDPDFYGFYKSMQTYRESIGRPEDVLVLNPNSHFFRFLHNNDSSN